jgi:hypothetical protein
LKNSVGSLRLEEAVECGRKAAIACRAPIEVRPFHAPEALPQNVLA